MSAADDLSERIAARVIQEVIRPLWCEIVALRKTLAAAERCRDEHGKGQA